MSKCVTVDRTCVNRLIQASVTLGKYMRWQTQKTQIIFVKYWDYEESTLSPADRVKLVLTQGVCNVDQRKCWRPLWNVIIGEKRISQKLQNLNKFKERRENT